MEPSPNSGRIRVPDEVSHQRVHQVVEASGGSRSWRGPVSTSATAAARKPGVPSRARGRSWLTVCGSCLDFLQEVIDDEDTSVQ